MRRVLFTLLFFVVCLIPALPNDARAWGDDGHRIVCAIAWDELQPAVRTKVESLLNTKGRDAFADACNWADDYRTGHPETAGWHFLNLPPSAKHIDLAHDCKAPTSCVVEQILEQFETLKSDSPKEARAMALKFVGHFVGDIHQPLHVSYAEDRGGNRIRGLFFGEKMDMHGVWDAGLISRMHRPWQDIANVLESRIKPTDRRLWQRSVPLTWAEESLAVARAPSTRYVNHPQVFDLADDYAKSEIVVVNDRLSRAGVRLGALLNGALR